MQKCQIDRNKSSTVPTQITIQQVSYKAEVEIFITGTSSDKQLNGKIRSRIRIRICDIL